MSNNTTTRRPAPSTPDHLRDVEAALPPLATIAEARAALRYGDSTIRQLIRSGQLRAIRSTPTGSSRLLIPRSEIIRFLCERPAA